MMKPVGIDSNHTDFKIHHTDALKTERKPNLPAGNASFTRGRAKNDTETENSRRKREKPDGSGKNQTEMPFNAGKVISVWFFTFP